MITNQSEAHGYHYRLAPRGYVFSVFAGRANGARTLVRSKIGRRRSLEISKRGSALPAFLRDKSRAPGEFLVGALNRYPARANRATNAWPSPRAWCLDLLNRGELTFVVCSNRSHPATTSPLSFPEETLPDRC